MQDYLTAAFHDVSRNPGYDGLLAGIRKVTALGVACMEKFGAPERKQSDIDTAVSRRP